MSWSKWIASDLPAGSFSRAIVLLLSFIAKSPLGREAPGKQGAASP
jgi:hypothetical protein